MHLYTYCSEILRINFWGSNEIHENRKTYCPQKFPAMQYGTKYIITYVAMHVCIIPVQSQDHIYHDAKLLATLAVYVMSTIAKWCSLLEWLTSCCRGWQWRHPVQEWWWPWHYFFIRRTQQCPVISNQSMFIFTFILFILFTSHNGLVIFMKFTNIYIIYIHTFKL